MLVRYRLVTAAVLAIACGSTALAAPIGAPFGPSVDLAPVPNGDLSAGLDGWGVMGPASSLVFTPGPIISASDNVTVLSPVIALPPGAQVVPVSIGAPGANTVVDIRVRRLSGGGDVEVLTIVPARGVTRFDVPVAQFAGQSIRLVLDPTTSIGRRMIIGGLGPVRSVLPGWSLEGAQPSVVAAWGRLALRVEGGRARLTTPPMQVARPARFLGFAVRGSGVVTASAGGRGVAATAVDTGWTWAYAPVPAGRPSTALALTVDPAVGSTVAIGPVATAARPIVLQRVSVSGRTVAAVVGTGAAGLRAVIRIGMRTVASATVPRTGRVVLASRVGGRATFEVVGDATRATARRVVRLG